MPGSRGTYNRTYIPELNLSDSLQIIYDLLLLKIQLPFVRQILPLATAAYSEMRTERLCPDIGIFLHIHHETFQKTFSFPGYLNIDNITGNGIGNK